MYWYYLSSWDRFMLVSSLSRTQANKHTISRFNHPVTHTCEVHKVLRSSRRYLVDVTRSIRATFCMRVIVVEHDVRTWLRGWFSLSLATDTARRPDPSATARQPFWRWEERGAMLGFLLRQQPLSVTLETSVDGEQATQFGTRRTDRASADRVLGT